MGGAVFPPLYLPGGGNEDNGDFLQKIPCMYLYPQNPQQATADPCLHWRLLDIPGQVGSVSCGVTDLLSWVMLYTKFCLCPPRVYFPVLCKIWQLYAGVNGDLLCYLGGF